MSVKQEADVVVQQRLDKNRPGQDEKRSRRVEMASPRDLDPRTAHVRANLRATAELRHFGKTANEGMLSWLRAHDGGQPSSLRRARFKGLQDA